jgi:hypothetical protein
LKWIPYLLILLAQLPLGASEWVYTKTEPSAVPAGTCQATAWSTTLSDGTKRAFTSTSVVLAASARLRLVEQPIADQAHGQAVASLMTTTGGIAAINGGYFTAEFAPAGLLVIDARTISSRSDEAVFSGFLAIDTEGKLSLRTRGDNLAGAVSARQAGPFVIDPGGTVGIKPSEHPAFARRTLAVVSTTGCVALVATSDVSLYDLASCLHDHPDGFGVEGVERSLNLDGGPSTALSVAGLKEPAVFKETASVRDVIVVMPGK